MKEKPRVQYLPHKELGQAHNWNTVVNDDMDEEENEAFAADEIQRVEVILSSLIPPSPWSINRSETVPQVTEVFQDTTSFLLLPLSKKNLFLLQLHCDTHINLKELANTNAMTLTELCAMIKPSTSLPQVHQNDERIIFPHGLVYRILFPQDDVALFGNNLNEEGECNICLSPCLSLLPT